MSIASFTRYCRDTVQVRWKTFNHFAANLFRKECTKFRQHRLSFVGDITKTFWSLYFLGHNVKVKVKVKWICIAPRREHTSKALRYGMRSQGISQFYLHTPHLSANGMNHTCLRLPSRSWYSFTDVFSGHNQTMY